MSTPVVETIVVAKRDRVGKSASRELRKKGLVPATIYGLNEPAVSIAISPKIVARVLASDTGMNSMLHLQREGTEIRRHVIIKDIQRDAVTGRLVHLDFMRVDPTHKVRVHVPIVLKGHARGRQGRRPPGLHPPHHRGGVPAQLHSRPHRRERGPPPRGRHGPPGRDQARFPPDRAGRRPQRDLLGARQGRRGRGRRACDRGRPPPPRRPSPPWSARRARRKRRSSLPGQLRAARS